MGADQNLFSRESTRINANWNQGIWFFGQVS
jgi:hypothetical protein